MDSCNRSIPPLSNMGISAAYTDFAVLSALQPYSSLKEFQQAYDISCIYHKNQSKRFQEVNGYIEQLSTINTVQFQRINSTVGEFHILAHTNDCHTYQNGGFREGHAVNDGEGMERVWAANTDLSDRTKEMNPGHRIDELTVHIADQNIRHLHSIREYSSGSCVR